MLFIIHESVAAAAALHDFQLRRAPAAK